MNWVASSPCPVAFSHGMVCTVCTCNTAWLFLCIYCCTCSLSYPSARTSQGIDTCPYFDWKWKSFLNFSHFMSCTLTLLMYGVSSNLFQMFCNEKHQKIDIFYRANILTLVAELGFCPYVLFFSPSPSHIKPRLECCSHSILLAILIRSYAFTYHLLLLLLLDLIIRKPQRIFFFFFFVSFLGLHLGHMKVPG